MRTLHCLYADDSDADRKRFERFIRNAWARLRTPVQLEITSLQSTDDARELLDREVPCDLLLVDIMFGSESAGLELIRDARPRLPSAIIIGISVKAEFREDALAVGADDFVTKGHITARDLNGDYLERVLKGAFKARGRDYLLADEVEVIYDDRDLAVMADVEEIGKLQFAALVVPLVERSCEKIVVERVRPGFSGSIVFRVICHLRVAENDPPEVRDILAKVSRERELLDREVARWDKLGSFPSELFVRNLRGPGIVSVGGWFAIGSEFQQSARTALEWIVREEPNQDKIREMLQWLFIDSGLAEFYDRQTLDDASRPTDAILSILSLSRRARALDAIVQFGSLATTHCGAVFDGTLLESALKFRRIGGMDASEARLGTQLCHCHGDFHARNVLVGVHSHPRLIDPANIGVMPLYSDVARFMADVFVSGWDDGDEAHDLANVPRWCQVAAAVVSGAPVKSLATSDPNKRVAVVIDWLHENVSAIYKRPAPVWQWHLALFVELVRCSYRGDLTGPKRTLSLAAACEALRQCERGFRGAT